MLVILLIGTGIYANRTIRQHEHLESHLGSRRRLDAMDNVTHPEIRDEIEQLRIEVDQLRQMIDNE